MPRYTIKKPDLVTIVADRDLIKYVPLFSKYSEPAHQLLYKELPHYKNCCNRDWRAMKGYVELLVQCLLSDKESVARFKEYMNIKYNVPADSELLFFFRGQDKLIHELF